VVIRKTILPFLYYAAISGAIGYGIVNMSTGIFNAGFIVAGLIVAGIIYMIARYGRTPSVP
jgi:lactate permease